MSRTPVEIPLENLSPEAQRGLVESFVLREGTDYGANEVDLEKKIEQVLRQIRSKDVLVCFDPESESVDILTKQEFRRRIANLKNESESL